MSSRVKLITQAIHIVSSSHSIHLNFPVLFHLPAHPIQALTLIEHTQHSQGHPFGGARMM